MKSEWMITLLTAGGILILCAAMIIWDKIRQRKWFLRHLKQRWGTVPDREYPGGTGKHLPLCETE